MKTILTILFVLATWSIYAQQAAAFVQKGNDAYREGSYLQAIDLYKKALTLDAENSAALYNTGNALHKLGKDAEAEKYFEKLSDIPDRDIKTKAWYNKGVLQSYQRKLPDAIASFKQALALNPDDNDARENLQKAINELKKQQQATNPQNNKTPPRQEKNKNKPPSAEMVEQKFNELRDKEKQLQKMLRKKTDTKNPDKDW